MSAWSLYDDLLDLVPRERRVAAEVVSHWAAVTDDEGGVGISAVYRGGPSDAAAARDFVGRPLVDLAQHVRSWDLELASLGAAALNCALTTADRLAPLPQRGGQDGGTSTFDLHAERLRGRTVGIVGHFGRVDALRADPVLDVTVLERRPSGADLPDPAAEYVLPGCDLVFVTGSALVNKTLPRLLELSSGAEVVIVGPSTTLAPEVFTGRASELAGSVVEQPEGLVQMVAAGVSLRHLRGRLRHYDVPLR